MAEQITTSSQSNNPQTNGGIKNSGPKVFEEVNKNILQTARTGVKGGEQTISMIPVQTNLHRLIQNKLKRKKKLPSCESPNDDTENKKRKTKDDIKGANPTDLCDNITIGKVDPLSDNKINRLTTKPPLPPRSEGSKSILGVKSLPSPPNRLKRKLNDQQNSNLIQKLSAQAEQLRLEISNLKISLTNERNAVRALRAQNEADTRKSRAELKKLHTTLESSKKAAITTSLSQKKNLKDDSNAVKDSSGDHGKLTQEILSLKEANRALEEKIHVYSEAERRKTSDIRELKDSYEIRLTQISKSAKIEINRLLEEIKTKERIIGQLKKEIHSLKAGTAGNGLNNKKDMRNVQHPPEMKKLKDIERTNNSNTNSSNQKCITATCGDDEFNSVPHEITERMLETHNDLHIFRTKDTNISSDSDSALSSAPQSISPQPPPGGIEPTDIWQSMKTYNKELENLQEINETVQRENDNLKMELESAKQQILKLEKTTLDIEMQHSNKMQQLLERIRYLEQKEYNLLKECHELKEQNELLEFRILELEESHDKWSLRSNSTPDTRDMWTDTERESDEVLMYTDRSDSGITSPHSHQHIEDRNIVSPCDLSLLDQITNDEIKRRITAMTKRPNIEEEDKLCLLQVLTLINNLETLSQDSLLVTDEMMSLDLVKSKISDYSSTSSSPRSLPADIQPAQKLKNSRIVATVLPYSSTVSTPTDSPRKYRSWNSNSLQESGVFEGESSEIILSQSTQTDPEDFPCTETPATGDLCAEIQKLNKFREKIEECVTKQATKVPVPVQAILSPNLSDQRRLQYYKDRLELLENKILIYESSGDLQTKRLAERLQREVHLEALVKDLRQRVENLETENLKLEEERCEFEEAENDTRLRLQRLEIDLEILNQRNLELELSKEAVQTKYKETRNQCTNLQESLQENGEKIRKLESEREELSNRIELIRISLPAIILFGAYIFYSEKSVPIMEEKMNPTEEITSSSRPETPGCSVSTSIWRSIIPFTRSLPQKVSQPKANNAVTISSCPYQEPNNSGLQNQLDQLINREKELTQSITELNRAYQETMENADILWAQIEKDYKDQLAEARNVERCLKIKISQLEERLANDSMCAQERINQLEENETNLKHRICRLNKDNKELAADHEVLMAEYQDVKDQMCKLKRYVEGPGQESLEKEKKKVKELEEEVHVFTKLMSDMEDDHQREIQVVRNQLIKTSKELEHISVTNSELKEEVCTLENQIKEFNKQHENDEEKIRCLTEEIKSKEENIGNLTTQLEQGPGKLSLAQEMYTGPGKRINIDDVTDLSTASQKLAQAIANIEHCEQCSTDTKNLQLMAGDVKDLADAVLLQQTTKKRKPDEVSNEEGDNNDDDKPSPANDQGGEINKQEETENEINAGGKEENETKDEDISESPETASPTEESAEVIVETAMTLTPISHIDICPIDKYSELQLKTSLTRKKQRTRIKKFPFISDQLPLPLKKLLKLSVPLPYLIQNKFITSRYSTKSKKMRSNSLSHVETNKKVNLSKKSKIIFPNMEKGDSAQSDLEKTEVLHKVDLNNSIESYTQDSLKIDKEIQTLIIEKLNYITKEPETCLSNKQPKKEFKSSLIQTSLDLSCDFQVCKENEEINPLNAVTAYNKTKTSKTEYLISLIEKLYSSIKYTEEIKSTKPNQLLLEMQYSEKLHAILELFETISKSGQSDFIINSYEDAVRATNYLKFIEDLYKPQNVPGLSFLNRELGKKIWQFFTNKSTREYVCQIYCPVNHE